MRYVIGIDPGVTGAVAVVDTAGGLAELVDIYDMPMLESRKGRREINALLLLEILRPLVKTGCEAWIEDLRPMPMFAKSADRNVCATKGRRIGHGTIAAFQLGRAVGTIEAVVLALRIPLRRVSAAKWKRHFGLIGRGKDASREEALLRWPSRLAWFKFKKSHNRAEAALIALYGWRQEAEQ